MAGKRSRARSTQIVVARPVAQPRYAAPRPIVIRTPAPQKMKRARRHKGGGGGGFGGLMSGGGGIVAVAVAAAIIGFAESSGIVNKLPSIPVVGRKGAVAIGAYYWSKHGGGSIARDVCVAAAALSGYELATKGSISGEDG